MTDHHTPSPPIAIIGIGCLFSKADNLQRYWANIVNGVDAIGDVPPTHWRPEDYLDQDPKKPAVVYDSPLNDSTKLRDLLPKLFGHLTVFQESGISASSWAAWWISRAHSGRSAPASTRITAS